MDEVGADGDLARYQGSMHEVHDKVDRIPYGTVNLGGTAGAFYALVPSYRRDRSFFIARKQR